MVVFGASLPSKKKQTKNKLIRVGPPLTKISGSAHDVSYLVFGRIHTKIHIKIFEIVFVIEIYLYLTFWPRPRWLGEKILTVANPIYVSSSHTKFGWISFNGKGEDSITDCDDVRKYLEIFLFFSKSLTCLTVGFRMCLLVSLRCLIYIFKGELHNLAHTCSTEIPAFSNTRTDLPR